MRRFLLALAWPLCCLLAACATPVPPAPVDRLLHDELFAQPATPVDTGAIFAVSDEMRRYLHHEIAAEIRSKGPPQGLVSALYDRGRLQLDYDAQFTRNAAQAFEARAGNCLSLVLMTTAFARELGLAVRYQSARIDEPWSRGADLLVRSGHINITFDSKVHGHGTQHWLHPLTVDFLPPDQIPGLRTAEIGESTVVAMYLNNRAVEILAAGRLDEAYAHARAAVRSDPRFASALNTLGVIYLRRGATDAAVRVYDWMLSVDPDSTQALANLAMARERRGEIAEAQRLRTRLAAIEANEPLHEFQLGASAMLRGDWRAAREHFERELAHNDDHEVHFRLAVANWRLGNARSARDELQLARTLATTRDQRELYAAKLDWLARHGVPASGTAH